MKAKEWIVQAYRVTENSSPSIQFKFGSISGATTQEKVDITSMRQNTIYYLKPGHIAIDAVCISEDKLDSKKYLILMQVSLSTYANHGSKFDSIKSRKVGVTPSIAEYYSDLSGVKRRLRSLSLHFTKTTGIRFR